MVYIYIYVHLLTKNMTKCLVLGRVARNCLIIDTFLVDTFFTSQNRYNP